MKSNKKLFISILLVLLICIVGLTIAITSIKNDLGANLLAVEDVENGDEINGDDEECDEEEGEDCEENGDDDDDDDEEVCNQERAMKSIENAERNIEKARERIEQKEEQGKDVTKALESIEEAKQKLEQAREKLQEGNCEGVEDAKGAKHKANLAKGKDVISVSPRALVARAYGKCISGAATSIKDNELKRAAFRECQAEFKNKVHDQIGDELPDDDQDANEKIHEYLDELLEDIEYEEFDEIFNDYNEYNFSGVDADEVIEKIDEILDSEMETSEKVEALEEYLEELKEESADDKYDDGIIPFEDIDDSEWFFAYIDILKEEGCIQGFVTEDGFTAEFRPGDNTLFGDSLKFVLGCMLDEEPEEIEEDDFWALGWALTLQAEYSEYISEEFLARVESAIENHDEFAEVITRSEIIAFILDILEIDVPEADPESSLFLDLPSDHPYFDEIVYAIEQGIISGDEEENTVRPDDGLNRAEMVKIIILANELL
ncbi:S-layer homology domain-containing protein [Patescibacteria group bacterium]